MDPVSAIELGVVAFEILGCVGKILNLLLNISTKFKHADFKVQLLIGFLSSLRISINEITIIADGLADREDYKDVVEGLRTTLDCTNLAVSLLDSKLDGLRSDSSDMKSKIEKLLVIIKGDEFGEWSSDIGHLVDALNLSLSALQSRTLLEQRGILASSEAQEIMHVVKARTSSMIWIEARKSANSQLSRSSETSVNLDLAFSFDHQLMGSKIYQIAQRSHLRKALAAERSQEPSISKESISTQSLYNDHLDASKTRHITDMPTIRGAYQDNPVPIIRAIDSVSTTVDIWKGGVSDPDFQTTPQADFTPHFTYSNYKTTRYSSASLESTHVDTLPPAAVDSEPATRELLSSTRTASVPQSMPAITVSSPSSKATPAPSVEIVKSFRVTLDDPCHKILPVVLAKYNIQDDWRQYALYAVYGDRERRLGLYERPLIYKQLDGGGKKPTFMLKRHTPPSEGHSSPNSVAGFDGSTSNQRALDHGIQLPGGFI